MQMDEGLDTGSVLLQQAVPILPDTTAGELTEALAELGTRLMLEALDGVAAGKLAPRPQPSEGVTYAPKLRREEARLDWRQPADALERQVRAFDPWPGAWFSGGGERIRVLRAEIESQGINVPPGTVLDDRLAIPCGAGGVPPPPLRAGSAPPGCDARLPARGRHYLSRILNRRAPPALERGRVWHVAPALDLDAMREGARHLVGHHDFSTFRDSLCQAKSPVKTLDALDVTREGEEIHIAARARSFLHHQVRNMAGTLKLVGLGSWQPADVATALAARDRRAGGPTAPAEGLALVAVEYDAV